MPNAVCFWRQNDRIMEGLSCHPEWPHTWSNLTQIQTLCLASFQRKAIEFLWSKSWAYMMIFYSMPGGEMSSKLSTSTCLWNRLICIGFIVNTDQLKNITLEDSWLVPNAGMIFPPTWSPTAFQSSIKHPLDSMHTSEFFSSASVPKTFPSQLVKS